MVGMGADGSCHRNRKEGKSDQYGLRDPKPASDMGAQQGCIVTFTDLWPFGLFWAALSIRNFYIFYLCKYKNKYAIHLLESIYSNLNFLLS